MNIYEKLSIIQNELKCPKGQYNSFGKFKYRSCEDILEAVKPICQKHKTVLILGDEVLSAGTRFYIKATARLYDIESEDSIENTAYAREDDEKKGMDGSQLTGTSSSYARKYALNGLFNIDDTRDADTDEFGRLNAPQEEDVGEKPIEGAKLDCIKNLNITPVDAKKVLAKFGYARATEIKVKDFAKVFEALKEVSIK